MRRHRLTVAGMLGIILVAAIGSAALSMADALWASAAYSLAIFLTLVALLGAIFSRDGLRAFSAGFAIFCGAYLILVFGPWSSDSTGWTAYPGPGIVLRNNEFQPTQEPLLTSRILETLHAMKNRTSGATVGSSVEVFWGGTYWPSTVIERKGDQTRIHYTNFGPNFDEWVGPDRVKGVAARRGPFLQVGHSLWALILGIIGGIIAELIRRGQPPRESVP